MIASRTTSTKTVNTMKQIVVATSPRTGSNLLVDSLGRHPNAISAGEWFNQSVEPFVEENKKLDNAIHRCNLFKIFSFEFEHPDCRTIFKDAFVVFLYREDKKAQLASWAKACQTGWFVAEVQGQPMPLREDAEYWIDQAHSLFEPIANYTISYEQMIAQWHDVTQTILTLAKWPIQDIKQARQKLHH